MKTKPNYVGVTNIITADQYFYTHNTSSFQCPTCDLIILEMLDTHPLPKLEMLLRS